MKIDRLLGILVMLAKKEKVTAPQLAEYFEVSRRTINRDIEILCMAGIPIVTTQGKHGGISIQEGYKLDKNIFTNDELSNIITGLKAVNSVHSTSDIENLINKVIPKDLSDEEDVLKIDLASFYKDSIAPKINKLKSAAVNRNVIKFEYYSQSGKSLRIAEPCYMVYRWDNWYLYAFCKQTESFRLFKLNRLWELEVLKEQFKRREEAKEAKDFDDYFTEEIILEAVFSKNVWYRLVDEYGPSSLTELENGELLFRRGFTNYEYMRSWVMGYGSDVKVLRPQRLIEDLKRISEEILNKYE